MKSIKNVIKKILQLRNDALFSDLLSSDLKMMILLDIVECGLDSDNIPYISLRSGETFYSFLPTENERILYSKHKNSLPTQLKEDCFRVGMDIIQRFFRENSAGGYSA